ncbi:22461_t:CDS:2, partial [Rhizophagus irregularis]
EDLLEHRMNLLDEKIMYDTLHGTYKKALQKALQTKTDSLRLIKILEDFANEDSEFESEDERLGVVKEDRQIQEGIKHQMRRIKAKKQSNEGVARNVAIWDTTKRIVMLSSLVNKDSLILSLLAGIEPASL